MFWWSASRYFQPSASPMRCRIDATERYPVPDEAGFGITTWPLYTGLVRSAQDVGAGRLCFLPTSVLKQKADM